MQIRNTKMHSGRKLHLSHLHSWQNTPHMHTDTQTHKKPHTHTHVTTHTHTQPHTYTHTCAHAQAYLRKIYKSMYFDDL